MGERSKARGALEVWRGDRPSLGDRVDATRAIRASRGTADPAPEPASAPDAAPVPAAGAAMPMPPPEAAGSWVWVALPDGSGTICARAIAWTRVVPDLLSPTGWALRVSSPYWRAFASWTGAGGVSAVPVEEQQVVPSSQVTPIPGHYEGVSHQE
ncbi:hypothetical protein [Yinghuangia sp. YIM S09857]|uniref:hypothetical protein n=1 Tax=Yinghuangia sp. YIM S09857 TaxID=3436929 RepID=UPI003F52D9E5